MEHRRAKKKASSRQKTPAKSPGAQPSVKAEVLEPVQMEVQPHGGSLRRGGTNKGGTGRPPNLIRAELRGSYDDRKAFTDRVIDGEVLVKIRYPVPELARHVKCSCGKPLVPASVDAMLETVEVTMSASVKDRLMALEHQAKYSLGQLREISVENVREKLERQVELLRNRFSGEVLNTLLRDLREVWNS